MITITVPEVDTLVLLIIIPKIVVTVPEELSILPLLKYVGTPYCLKRFPSLISLTLTKYLSNAIFNWAPEIAALRVNSYVQVKSLSRTHCFA